MLQLLKTLTSRIVLWLCIVSVLYSGCALMGVEKVLPTRRLLTTSTHVDATVFGLCCQFVCITLAELFLFWQLERVTADRASVFKTAASVAAFVVAAVPLLSRTALGLGFRALLSTTPSPAHPLVTKCALTYCGATLCSLYRQLSGLTSSRVSALKIVSVLLLAWSAAVALMSWGYLQFNLFHSFSETEVLVDEWDVDYVPMILVSFLVFVVVDSALRYDFRGSSPATPRGQDRTAASVLSR